MMDSNDNIDLSAAFKKLLAHNKSQEAGLEEYANIIDSRNREIEMLQTMLSASNEYRSSTDNQLKELNNLQHYISDLQHQVAGTVSTLAGGQQQPRKSGSVEEQFHALNLEYTYLQLQLKDLQMQLQDLTTRNLLLQQQTSRIAALESLLENAEREKEDRQRKK